jgi:hypothetical protein
MLRVGKGYRGMHACEHVIVHAMASLSCQSSELFTFFVREICSRVSLVIHYPASFLTIGPQP